MESLQIENSSQVVAVAYDAVEAKLYIEYKPKKDGTRAAYTYHTVPASEYDRLREVIVDPSQSVGSYIAKNIKPRFTCTGPIDAETTVAIFGEVPAPGIIHQCAVCAKVDIDPATHAAECDPVEEAILRERRDR